MIKSYPCYIPQLAGISGYILPTKKDKYNMHTRLTLAQNSTMSPYMLRILSYSFLLNTVFLLSDFTHHFRDQPFNFKRGKGDIFFSIHIFFSDNPYLPYLLGSRKHTSNVFQPQVICQKHCIRLLFVLHQNQNIFFSATQERILFFQKEKHNLAPRIPSPPQVIWSVPYSMMNNILLLLFYVLKKKHICSIYFFDNNK